MKTKEKIASGTPIGLAVTPEVNTISILDQRVSHFLASNRSFRGLEVREKIMKTDRK